MALLLSFLLANAAAQDLPKDPVEQKMVIGEEEQRGTQEMERAQELMERLKALRERHAQDGDLARYERERQPVVAELWNRLERIMNVRTDIKLMHTKAGIINALSVAADFSEGKSKHAEGVVGTRMVQFTRLVGFDRQLMDSQDRVTQALKDESAFFRNEQESARQRKRLALLAGAACLVLAAAGTLLVFKLRKEG